MKRIFAIILTAVMLFTLCSCGGTKVDFYCFEGNFSPFFARTTYDMSVAAQVSEALLVTSGEDASVVYDGYTKGLGIADIDVQTENGKSICTIKIGRDIYFTDGTQLTAKDVIFSMYVYADLNYTGWSSFYASALDGLVNYQYGTDEAENIVITAEELAAELEDPSELTQKYIKQNIILPILEAESEWVKTLYVDESYKGTDVVENIKTYPDAHKLFEYYYSIVDSDVSTEGITDMDAMVAAVAQQYGTNWKLLGDVYGSDLTDLAEECATRAIMYERLGITSETPSGGKIRGIEYVDEYTLKVTVNSTSKSDVSEVLGIYVAPFSYYGIGSTDNGDGSFTIDYEGVKQNSAVPVGAGEYVFEKYVEGKYVRFSKNENYFRDTEREDKLVFNVTYNAFTPTAHKYFVSKDNLTYAE